MYKEYENTKQTKAKLKKIFIMQALEHGVTNVSVNTIIKLAGINRSTFYIHYHNLPELIVDIEKDILKKYQQVLNQGNPKTKQEFVDIVCKTATDDYDKLKFVINSGCFPKMLNSLRDLLSKYIQNFVDGTSQQKQIKVVFASSGVVNVLRHCVTNNIDVNSIKNILVDLIN